MILQYLINKIKVNIMKCLCVIFLAIFAICGCTDNKPTVEICSDDAATSQFILADSVLKSRLFDSLKQLGISRNTGWLNDFLYMKDKFNVVEIPTDSIFHVRAFKYFKNRLMRDYFVIAVDEWRNYYYLHGFAQCDINKLIIKTGVKPNSLKNMLAVSELYISTVGISALWKNTIVYERNIQNFITLFKNLRPPMVAPDNPSALYLYAIESEVGWIYKYSFEFSSDTIKSVKIDTVITGASRIQT